MQSYRELCKLFADRFSAAYHPTSTAVDCRNLFGTRLRFYRWLGVEGPAYDHASVRVSSDGIAWTTVWQNETTIDDSSWVAMELDILSVADDQPTVFLRWTMGPTDGGWTYCGWNLDDVEVLGSPVQGGGLFAVGFESGDTTA